MGFRNRGKLIERSGSALKRKDWQRKIRGKMINRKGLREKLRLMVNVGVVQNRKNRSGLLKLMKL